MLSDNMAQGRLVLLVGQLDIVQQGYYFLCSQSWMTYKKTLLKIRTEVGKTRLYPISPSWVVFDPPAGCLRPFRSKIALILVSWPTGYNRPSRNADISWELDNWSSTSRWSNYNCPASPASAKFDKYQIFIFPTMIRNLAGQHHDIRGCEKVGKGLGWNWKKKRREKSSKLPPSNSDWVIQKCPQKTQFGDLKIYFLVFNFMWCTQWHLKYLFYWLVYTRNSNY